MSSKMSEKLGPRNAAYRHLGSIIKDTVAPGIYYEDFPALSGFTRPEWSHLSASDSVEFSKRLAPHLRTALQM